ncbi:hypothetical protein [Shewanella surugensis]|uniref:Uncharacterized protein n=1 Tax=Shewanella surugensis TaxID=212020 RepID=A0ABT0LFL8_9GAMM|nr:hypothetical protein [Shewanella surugensis]MCL1125946.1 hypothetical protein [Shewanella surugensis]
MPLYDVVQSSSKSPQTSEQTSVSSVSKGQKTSAAQQDVKDVYEQHSLEQTQDILPRLSPSHIIAATPENQKNKYQQILLSPIFVSSTYESNRLEPREYKITALVDRKIQQPNVALSTFFGQLKDIQVEVMPGANSGNESSTFDLIKNLRNLGYQGHITVLTNGTPDPFRHHYELKVEIDTSKISATDFIDEFFKYQSSAVREENAKIVHVKVKDNGEYDVKLEINAQLGNYKFSEPSSEEILDFFSARATLLKGKQMLKEGSNDCNLLDLTSDGKYFGVTKEIARLSKDNVDGEKRLFPNISPNNKVTIKFSLEMSSEGYIDFDKLEKINPKYTELEGVTWIKKGDEQDRTATANPNETIYIRSANDTVVDSTNDSGVTPKGYLQLQPFQWHSEDRFVSYDGSRVDFHTNTDVLTFPGTDVRTVMPRDASYKTFEPIARKDYVSRLNENETRVGDQATANLSQIFANTMQKEMGLMTSYGIHQAKDGDSAAVLDLVTRGLVEAGKNATLPSVNVMLVSYSGSDLKEKLPNDKSVEYVHINDASLAEKIDQAKQKGESKLFVVHANGLPQPIFQIAMQESTYPILTEGANTMGQTLSLGKELLLVNYNDKDTSRTTYPNYDLGLIQDLGLEETFDSESLQNGRKQLLKLTDVMYKSIHSDEDVQFTANVLSGNSLERQSVVNYYQACSSIKYHPVMDQTAVGLLALSELKAHVVEHGPVLSIADQQRFIEIKERYTQITESLSVEDKASFIKVVTSNPVAKIFEAKKANLDIAEAQLNRYQKIVTERRMQEPRLVLIKERYDQIIGSQRDEDRADFREIVTLVPKLKMFEVKKVDVDMLENQLNRYQQRITEKRVLEREKASLESAFNVMRALDGTASVTIDSQVISNLTELRELLDGDVSALPRLSNAVNRQVSILQSRIELDESDSESEAGSVALGFGGDSSSDEDE